MPSKWCGIVSGGTISGVPPPSFAESRRRGPMISASSRHKQVIAKQAEIQRQRHSYVGVFFNEEHGGACNDFVLQKILLVLHFKLLAAEGIGSGRSPDDEGCENSWLCSSYFIGVVYANARFNRDSLNLRRVHRIHLLLFDSTRRPLPAGLLDQRPEYCCDVTQ